MEHKDLDQLEEAQPLRSGTAAIAETARAEVVRSRVAETDKRLTRADWDYFLSLGSATDLMQALERLPDSDPAAALRADAQSILQRLCALERPIGVPAPDDAA